MAETTGIIFSDLFISDRQFFIDFFTSYYQENQSILEPIVFNLQQVLKKYTFQQVTENMAAEFKKCWDEFQQKVLLNSQELQLLVAYRGQGGENGEFSRIVPQSEVEETALTKRGREYGINAGNQLIRDSIAALRGSKVEQFLQHHLNTFLRHLDSQINKNEAAILHRYHTDQLNQYYAQKGRHLTNVHWREAFFGGNNSSYFGGRGLGKAYDAFMNHMANKEKGIYDYLRSNGKIDEEFNLKINENTSVYIEENRIGPYGHYPQLLKNAMNTIGWYTGGDIVIVNPETMQVVYNIQLKTTTAKKASVFAERVGALRTFIDKFVSTPITQKAENLFNFLLTEISNSDDFNQLPQKTINAIIEQNLTSKLIKN